MIPSFKRVKTYRSKKNHVYAVDIQYKEGKKRRVLKDFHAMESKQKEVFYLQLLGNSRLKVPELIDHHHQMILLEHIDGETLLDYISHLEENQIDPNAQRCMEVFTSLLSWLGEFYRITEEILGKKIIFGDVNFRNFIINDHLYGFDFEDCKEGIPEEDGGAICAHLLTYYPEDTLWKRRAYQVLQHIMIEDYDYDAERLNDATNHYLHVIKSRRSKLE